MKRFGLIQTSAILMVLLVLTMAPPALADAWVESTREFEGNVKFDSPTGTYYTSSSPYVLYDAEGHALTESYSYLRGSFDGGYQVYQKSGINTTGLIDTAGQLVVPMSYGAITTQGDHWVIGGILMETEDSNAPYRDWFSGKYYGVGQEDVYFDGRMIGTLSGDECDINFNVSEMGSFLCVTKPDGTLMYIDEQFNITATYGMIGVRAVEFAEDGNGNVFHQPTGQAAFTAGCTLTPNQVKQSIWYDKARGAFLDLQGNVLSSGHDYDRVSYSSSNRQVTTYRKNLCGLVDEHGQVLLPAEFNSVYAFDTAYGFALVRLQSGELAYVGEGGQVLHTLSAEKSQGLYTTDNPPFSVFEADGQYGIFTPTAGELPDRYDEVDYSRYRRKRLAAVRKGDLWGVIDMNGNEVIPLTLTASPKISYDNRYVYSEVNNAFYNTNTIYTIAYDD